MMTAQEAGVMERMRPLDFHSEEGLPEPPEGGPLCIEAEEEEECLDPAVGGSDTRRSPETRTQPVRRLLSQALAAWESPVFWDRNVADGGVNLAARVAVGQMPGRRRTSASPVPVVYGESPMLEWSQLEAPELPAWDLLELSKSSEGSQRGLIPEATSASTAPSEGGGSSTCGSHIWGGRGILLDPPSLPPGLLASHSRSETNGADVMKSLLLQPEAKASVAKSAVEAAGASPGAVASPHIEGSGSLPHPHPQPHDEAQHAPWAVAGLAHTSTSALWEVEPEMTRSEASGQGGHAEESISTPAAEGVEGDPSLEFDDESLGKTPAWWSIWWRTEMLPGGMSMAVWEEAGDALRYAMKAELQQLTDLWFAPRTDLEQMAIAFFERGKLSHRDDAIVLYRKALACTSSQQLAASVLACRADAFAHSRRSRDHRGSSLKLAEVNSTLALCLDPYNHRVLQLRGRIRQLRNNRLEALKDLRRALTVAHDYEDRCYIKAHIAKIEEYLARKALQQQQQQQQQASADVPQDASLLVPTDTSPEGPTPVFHAMPYGHTGGHAGRGMVSTPSLLHKPRPVRQQPWELSPPQQQQQPQQQPQPHVPSMSSAQRGSYGPGVQPRHWGPSMEPAMMSHAVPRPPQYVWGGQPSQPRGHVGVGPHGPRDRGGHPRDNNVKQQMYPQPPQPMPFVGGGMRAWRPSFDHHHQHHQHQPQQQQPQQPKVEDEGLHHHHLLLGRGGSFDGRVGADVGTDIWGDPAAAYSLAQHMPHGGSVYASHAREGPTADDGLHHQMYW